MLMDFVYVAVHFHLTGSHCSVDGSILGNQFSVQFDVDIPQVSGLSIKLTNN